MNSFVLFAQPWWVNLLILVPTISYFYFRTGLNISKRQLMSAAVFGVAFGFVEAAVVVYLRTATGLEPMSYQPDLIVNTLPKNLLTLEFFRNAATIIMLAAIALLAVKPWKERWAMFLWVFAFWDIFYYVWLWATIKWPLSLISYDVLFLIPVPWMSQVWFPFLVSGASILAVALNIKNQNANR